MMENEQINTDENKIIEDNNNDTYNNNNNNNNNNILNIDYNIIENNNNIIENNIIENNNIYNSSNNIEKSNIEIKEKKIKSRSDSLNKNIYDLCNNNNNINYNKGSIKSDKGKIKNNKLNKGNSADSNSSFYSPNLVSERSENGCYTPKSYKSEASIINIETLFQDDEETDDSEDFDFDDDESIEAPELIDYSEMIINILYPVCITMIIVVLAIRSISNIKNGSSNVTLTSSLNNSDGTSVTSGGGADTMVFDSLINSLIFLAVIILSTTIMVVLYKFKMMKALYAWLMGTSILLLGVFGGFLFLVMLAYLNLGLDYITFVIVVWNFSVGGIVCIFWYAPKIMNQGYLISISVLLALFFSRLPDWTTWGILTVVSIYDIFAVLCPGGPLKILIETAQKRGEEIPAMIYNASVYVGMVDLEKLDGADGSITPPPSIPQYIKEEKEKKKQQQQQNTLLKLSSDGNIIDETNDTVSNVESDVDSQSESSQKRKQSIRLGLGDFVFYSVLIGKAASYDIITVFTVFIAIITGLFLTLFLLAVFKKALPALPMSIVLGIGVFFLTFKILIQYIYFLGSNQIFV